MKIKENVTVYTCEHCNKKYFVKPAAERHELHCGSNPATFPMCNGCGFLKEIEKEIHVGSEESGYYRNCKAFFCEARKVGLYPAKVARTGHLQKYPETFEGEIQMPKECEFFGPNPDDEFPW